ncbi:uncharacterized protein LOC143154853 [Ptiloglossa arizonensis]|uniref:uncharacterized protein LOC143154853 n=1 Tax=Ptiloglossa arizonensis TaxID=3350558 RepID=UPI003FA075D7
MAVKNIRKNNGVWRTSESKMSTAPTMGLITENVLVPIRKTIFVKKMETTRSNFFEQKTELIKPHKCSNNLTIPLLKRPPHIPVKRYTNTLLRSEQNNKLNSRQKKKMSKKSLTLIDKSSTFPVVDRFENSQWQSRDKKKTILSFPSSISDLPNNSFTKRKLVSVNKNSTELNKWKKDHQIGEQAMLRVNRVLSNVSDEDESVTESLSDVHKIEWFTTNTFETVFDKEIQLLESNISNTPITLTVTTMSMPTSIMTTTAAATVTTMTTTTTTTTMATTTTTTTTTTIKTNSYAYKKHLIPPYYDNSLTNTDVIEKKTLSNNITDHSEELQFPVGWTGSNFSNQIQFTAFDLPTSDNSLETNETSGIMEDKRNKILSTCNFRYTGTHTDSLCLSSLLEKQSRCYDETGFSKNEYPCRIKYSWQVVGVSSQTSRTLLENLIKENDLDDELVHDCCIKYSWQIIGSTTQTSKTDFTVSECRSILSFISPKPNAICNVVKGTIKPLPMTIRRNGKRFFVLNNQCTQTFAHKENQTNFADIYINHDPIDSLFSIKKQAENLQ